MIDFPDVNPEYIEYLLCYTYTCDPFLAMNNLQKTLKIDTSKKVQLLELAEKYLSHELKEHLLSELQEIMEVFADRFFKRNHPQPSEKEITELTAVVKAFYDCEIPAGEELRKYFVEMVLRSPQTVHVGRKFRMVAYERLIRATPKAALDIFTTFSKKPSGQLMKALLEYPAALKMLTEDIDFTLHVLNAVKG